VQPVEDATPDADKLFEGRVNGEKDRVLEPVLRREVNGESGQQNAGGQDDRKGAKNILLVEDNQVNMKVRTA
jgi:hypothetical protein